MCTNNIFTRKSLVAGLMPLTALVVGESDKLVQVVNCHVLTAISLVRMLGSVTMPYSDMEVGRKLTISGYGIIGGDMKELNKFMYYQEVPFKIKRGRKLP
jgi:hypothetical protein